jgi:8-oxo-dGTP pyrophosphatase MutT (NUDIX family)
VQGTLDFIRDVLTDSNFLAIGDASDDPALVQAGVLLLTYLKDGEVCVLLNKRTDRVKHHKGEISFPGGARDPEDATILDTALREANEEMGVEREDVEVLCRLDQVSTSSRFAITPFVGTIRPSYPFHTSQSEVAEVLEVPLSVLLDPANWREVIMNGGRGWSGGFAYAYGEHLIWGATARILTQFLFLIAPSSKLTVGV